MPTHDEQRSLVLDNVRRTLFAENDQLFERWLYQPVPALEGKTPNELLAEQSGIEVLEDYLCRMKYGDFS